MSFWFRTNPGARPDDDPSEGMKFLMLGKAGQDGPRYQFAISQVKNGTAERWVPLTGPHFGGQGTPEVYNHYVWGGAPDQPPPFRGDDPAAASSPWRNGLNDGNWHRMTTELQSGSPGYVKGWIDGVLVYDDEGAGVSYPFGVDWIRMFGNFAFQPNATFQLWLDDLTLWQR